MSDMRKITKCTGEGQGSCTRCTENGKWNRTWMCFLNKIEGLDGIYCNDCTKELVKHLEQFEPNPITEENSSVRKSCPDVFKYDCEDCDQDPVQCYNEGKCIMEE